MAKTGHVDTFVRDNLPPADQLPEFRFDLPELHYPDRLNAATLLDRAVAAGFGDRPALVWGTGAWSYADYLAKSAQVARVLVEDMGLKAGNRVLLHGPNRPWTFACWWGIVRAGGVVVATMPMLRAGELEVVAEKAQIDFALADGSLAEAVEGARTASGRLATTLYFGEGGELEGRAATKPATFEPADTAADDPVLIAFTSGTTGEPKGCVHLHRDVLAMADTFSRHVLRPEPDEVFCGTPPIAFTFGLGALVVFPAAAGACTALPERPGFEGLCETIARHGVTTLFTAPTGYRALLKLCDEQDLSSLRKCVSAGEALPAATSDAWWVKTGLRIIDGIGATEMIHIFISAPPEAVRPGATGVPVPGYQAKIVDEEGRTLGRGAVGRLAVRGPTGCRYLADERQSVYVRDGWNFTGDVYRVDEGGWFWFVARADDMIVSSGYNISPLEVEGALLSHPAVLETAVAGAPDKDRGTVCKAWVVLHDRAAASPALATALQEHVKAAIAPYKYPRVIEFVDQLPKTQTGKIQRFRLREDA